MLIKTIKIDRGQIQTVSNLENDELEIRNMVTSFFGSFTIWVLKDSNIFIFDSKIEKIVAKISNLWNRAFKKHARLIFSTPLFPNTCDENENDRFWGFSKKNANVVANVVPHISHYKVFWSSFNFIENFVLCKLLKRWKGIRRSFHWRYEWRNGRWIGFKLKDLSTVAILKIV